MTTPMPDLTSATVRPAPHPFYGDSYERGLDPWHFDAFPPGLKHAAPNQGPRRAEGWYLLDGVGNVIGWVPDGTPVNAPPQSKLMIAEAKESLHA
jgi:hypothetical protein